MQTNSPHQVIQYAGYDKTTGRIVHTHTRFSVQENRYVEIPIDELRRMFSNDGQVLGRVTNRDPNNLDYLKVELPESGRNFGPMMVDHAHRKLVPRSSLKLHTNKREIAGDGQDSADIEMSVVDPEGKVIESYAGAIKVTTSRGRLSARGGLVNLERGRARITLTSANETVSHVRVTATSVGHTFAATHIDLEFV